MYRLPLIIRRKIRKDKDIVYGTRAMNAQLPHHLKRNTFDFDVYTKRPKQKARAMDKRLDRKLYGGKNVFYTTPAIHKGTWKVRHRGADRRRGTEDDFDVVDYTQRPKRVRTFMKNGIRYESLSSIKKIKRKILKDPESKYRHEKDRRDLRRIKVWKRLRG